MWCDLFPSLDFSQTIMNLLKAISLCVCIGYIAISSCHGCGLFRYGDPGGPQAVSSCSKVRKVFLSFADEVCHRVMHYCYSISRESAKEYHYKNISIPAGAVVYVPIFLIHKDSKSWKDPDKFDPLR